MKKFPLLVKISSFTLEILSLLKHELIIGMILCASKKPGGWEEYLVLPLQFIKDIKPVTAVSLQAGDLENL